MCRTTVCSRYITRYVVRVQYLHCYESGNHVTESCSIDSTGCPQWRLVYMVDQTTYQYRRRYLAYFWEA